jgi:predicted 3-demethylubiquinone-9 3-methyltransferase (glyoxalase superfamily)
LWYDKEAKVAADFYVQAFNTVFPSAPQAKILREAKLEGTPSGDVDMLTIELLGEEFSLISAGPFFTFNPSISFHVACKTVEEVDALWKQLSDGGKVLMELGTYPFSQRYGWLNDKYGLSWQIIYVGDKAPAYTIKPVLLFVGDVCGKTEEAVNFYTSVFSRGAGSEGHESKTLFMQKYGKGQEPDKEGTVQYAGFVLEGKEFGAMDSAHEHKFAFNEAISFMVHCNDQAEIDYYWEKLSAVPASEQCGWLKDKYGVSWQIVPTVMDEMLAKGSKEQIARVTQAFLQMKKFDIAELQKAYVG